MSDASEAPVQAARMTAMASAPVEEGAAIEVLLAHRDNDGAGGAAGDGARDGGAEAARDGGPVPGGEHRGGNHEPAIGNGDDADSTGQREGAAVPAGVGSPHQLL